MIDNPFTALADAPVSRESNKVTSSQKAANDNEKPFSNEMKKAESDVKQDTPAKSDSRNTKKEAEPNAEANTQAQKSKTESGKKPAAAESTSKQIKNSGEQVEAEAVSDNLVAAPIINPVSEATTILSDDTVVSESVELSKESDLTLETPVADVITGETPAPEEGIAEVIATAGVAAASVQEKSRPTQDSASLIKNATVKPVIASSGEAQASDVDAETALDTELDIAVKDKGQRQLNVNSEKPVPTAVVTELQRLTSLVPNTGSADKTLLQLAESLGIETDGQTLDNKVMTQLKEALTANLQSAGTSQQGSQTAAVALAKDSLSVTIPFAQKNWGEAMSEKVLWMASKGVQSADIQLDPPELGPLQVKISVENDQAHVSFVAQNSSVKDALDQNAARLREMFDAEGLDLVDVDVSSQSDQQKENEASDQELASSPSSEDVSVEKTGVTEISVESGIDAYA